MEANCNPDKLIAQTLAAPFTPRSQGNPLAFKLLHDGGMVVIIADGRKLWFSASEVQAARRQIHEQAQKEAPPRVVHSRLPIKLAPGEGSPAAPPKTANPPASRKPTS